jgi:hypothetical protein
LHGAKIFLTRFGDCGTVLALSASSAVEFDKEDNSVSIKLTKSLIAATVGMVVLTSGRVHAAPLTFTCSTVARQHQTDPDGAEFKSRFEHLAINGAGDVVFLARAPKRNLYLYPNAGSPVVAIPYGSPAPGGGGFSDEFFVSINEGGDIGFHGRLYLGGEGVYVRKASGTIVKAANSTDTSPGGGAYHEFPSNSRVNAAGHIAFAALVNGGPHGVFLFNGVSVTAVALAGDVTTEGRTFCDFVSAGLGDSDLVAFEGVTQMNCADTLEVPEHGIYYRLGVAPVVTVGRQGQPSPRAGAMYNRFYDTPDVSSSNKFAYRARLQGEVAYMAYFLHDPAGPSTVQLAAAGDGVPPPAQGFIKTISTGQLTNTDQIALGGKVRGPTTRRGIFLFGGMAADVQTDGDAPPTDQFGFGADYRKMDPRPAVDRTGSKVAFATKVQDTVPPRGKQAVIRCDGM